MRVQDELLVIGFKAQRKKKEYWTWFQVRKGERVRSVNDVIGL